MKVDLEKNSIDDIVLVVELKDGKKFRISEVNKQLNIVKLGKDRKIKWETNVSEDWIFLS